jgi:hypothetical protein
LFEEANRALDALRKANLTGSFRDGSVIVLGLTVVAASSVIAPPQEWVILGIGIILALMGTMFIILRLFRSFQERREL